MVMTLAVQKILAPTIMEVAGQSVPAQLTHQKNGG